MVVVKEVYEQLTADLRKTNEDYTIDKFNQLLSEKDKILFDLEAEAVEFHECEALMITENMDAQHLMKQQSQSIQSFQELICY